MPRNVKKLFVSLFAALILFTITACPGLHIDYIQITFGINGSLVGEIITFTAISPVSPSQVDQYLWDFGDGNSAVGKKVTHIYIAPGTYSVQVRIVTSNASASAMDYVSGQGIFTFTTLLTIESASGSVSAGGIYVVNIFDNDVSVLDVITETNTGITIPTGTTGTSSLVANQIAITPDGTRAYVTNAFDNDVSVLDLATNTNLGIDIPVGDGPTSIAITPDGTRAYVTNGRDNDVSVLDLTTNTNLGIDIPVGGLPLDIAITVDGTGAYVANFLDNDVSVLDLSSNTNLAIDISVAVGPTTIAIPQNGLSVVYVSGVTAQFEVILQGSNALFGFSFPLGGTLLSDMATPAVGNEVYVVNHSDNVVSVFDALTFINNPHTPPTTTDISVGNSPSSIAISSDGTRAYVTNEDDDDVSVLDLTTNTNLGIDIAVGDFPTGIAIR